MAYPKKQNKSNRGQAEQNKMARNLDTLDKYDDFINNILPRLQKVLMDDTKDESDIIAFAGKELAARMVTIALSEPDPKVAMSAIKDLMDRKLGKAKETVNVTTRYENLSDADIERMIAQEEQILEDTTKH